MNMLIKTFKILPVVRLWTPKLKIKFSFEEKRELKIVLFITATEGKYQTFTKLSSKQKNSKITIFFLTSKA